MCRNKNAFENLTNGPISNVSTAGKENLVSYGTGTVRINIKLHGKLKSVKLTNVLYVPELRSNLLSVPIITEKKYEVKFKGNNAYIIRPDNTVVFSATKRSRIYVIKHIENNEVFNVNDNSELKLKLWHERYGHLNYNDLRELFDKRIVRRLDLPSKNQKLSCKTCDLAKIPCVTILRGESSEKYIRTSTYGYLWTNGGKIIWKCTLFCNLY